MYAFVNFYFIQPVPVKIQKIYYWMKYGKYDTVAFHIPYRLTDVYKN